MAVVGDAAVSAAATQRISPVVDPDLDRPLPEAETVLIPFVPDETPDEPDGVADEVAPRSDFTLLRQHADVRARCVAAVVVPIAAYIAVLAIIGRLTASTVLIWSAIPLVTAGVLFGVLLDAGHRKYRVSESPDRP